jgi:hypothetical protein
MNSFVCCTGARAKSVLRQTAGCDRGFIGLIDMLGVFIGLFTIVRFFAFPALICRTFLRNAVSISEFVVFWHVILGCRAGTDSAYMEL